MQFSKWFKLKNEFPGNLYQTLKILYQIRTHVIPSYDNQGQSFHSKVIQIYVSVLWLNFSLPLCHQEDSMLWNMIILYQSNTGINGKTVLSN